MVETSATRLRNEASAWLVALDGGSADPADFEQWRAADPRHAVAFAEAACAWRELDRLRAVRGTRAVLTAERPSRRGALRALGATAALAIAGAVALPRLDGARAETGTGERRSLALPDGSRIDLNTRTRIDWRRWNTGRRLWLAHGEIALDVAPGESPFTLLTSRPVALGQGSYDIRRDADRLIVQTLSGQATVNGQVVSAGRTLVIAADHFLLTATPPGARANAAAWRRGEIIFDGESLAGAVADFNRYLDRPMTVTDPALVGLRVGGRFRTDEPLAFLRAVATEFDVRVVDRAIIPTNRPAPAKKTSRAMAATSR